MSRVNLYSNVSPKVTRRFKELLEKPFGPVKKLTPKQINSIKERTPIEIADAKRHAVGDNRTGIC